MITHVALPDTLPLFPLPGALLLPRARLPLHIFEPRYLQMIEDCMATSARLIGMIQPLKGPEGQNHMNAIGCAGRLTGFSETEDGRYMITLAGVSRFRFTREVSSDAPYLRAQVDWAPFKADLSGPEHDTGFERAAFFALLERFFVAQGLETDWESLQDADDELLINSLGMLLPLEPEDKQALLEAPDLSHRRKTLMALLEFALHGGGEEKLQ